MRTSSSTDQGVHLEAVFAANIAKNGTVVLVLPSAARAAAGQLARPLPAIIEAAEAASISTMRLEGDINADNPDATIFTFAGDTGVAEGDRVAYRGHTYVFLDAPPQPFGNGILGIRCLGVRTLG